MSQFESLFNSVLLAMMWGLLEFELDVWYFQRKFSQGSFFCWDLY